ncbi:16S rRNA (uracil(1498)-N(3))-methyltransferase [Microvirga sp. 3-52]|uniref:16S rRNA (uracil(1498)-N(3))-methyltransferase n=1 Tax=Microvirga sp. 3-52 TaxID=2792425 RepID=UPI001AC6E810|nr:16S rRNA (uracil(1498)-N(3))-methyltransferase [Microvirga sp. 3-52]MBO1907419.1 16S rRNA (uracil(1498)-N(3))-methyltransferase [Microvirga sp. 3-52]MBS7454349.1 16S rRNA (uracil(1498)-N(3))-methyltransferase [Microvirga sp. 3-52]
MAAYDFNAPRLFIDAPLQAGARIALDRGQANYLLNVLRLKAGETVLIFNGRDGEWRAEVMVEGRKAADLVCAERIREQEAAPDIIYAFAPLKHARLDYMVQKAVEMGAGVLQPVLTRRTQASRINLERMRSNAVEAAEQCGILSIPEVREEENLERFLNGLEKDRLVVFCDENAPVSNPVEALAKLGNNQAGLVVIVGPEGGFTDQERALVAAHERCVCVSLGPRILRADTAAVAALAIVQAVLGDWN